VIRSGIKAGETVVTDGQLRLVPGAKVEDRPLTAPGESGAAGAGTAAPKQDS
jgi:multidrug efflux system membrane fusion protein